MVTGDGDLGMVVRAMVTPHATRQGVTRRGWIAVAAVAAAGCGAGAVGPAAPAGSARTSEVALYRDRAVIAQRVEVDVAAGRAATLRVTVAAGVSAGEIYLLDRGDLGVTVRAIDAAVAPPRRGADRPIQPTELELTVTAPRAGRWALRLGYTTDRLAWDVAYTMTTTPARDRAVVRGALAIRNTTGIALPAAQIWVVDGEIGISLGELALRLGSALSGADAPPAAGAAARALGRFDLADGDTRIELLAGAPARPMRAVLVYDPIGTRLDHPGPSPVRDPELGVRPPPSPRVSESFEVQRDVAATAGLPAGPVRLLERRADGSLALLGESRLFDVATRVAVVDTIAIGTADGVTGKRERRELTIDEDGKRVVEEFAITLANARPRSVEVVVREHLYRGQNWTLAYQSVPVGPEAKEGPQQIALRTRVPAHGTTRVLYVVVYTW